MAIADLVLYDQLVPKRILDFAHPDAELVCVRDLPATATDKYPIIYTRILEAARAGKQVVRLKGGDPLVFGRGGEEAEVLRDSGVRYEIVPGVTAALATAAYLDLPLTHRNHTSAVAFITGHELPHKPGSRLDWAALAKFPGTLAIYMGIARLPVLIAELMKHGKDPETPAVIAERVSTGEMRSVYSKLEDLEKVRRAGGLEAPGLIVIGEAARNRLSKSWFEQRPLFGRRVLITRPKHQAEPLIRQLERLGAVPLRLPLLKIRPPEDFGPLDAAIAKMQEFDWLVFSSRNGVDGLMNRLKFHGKDARALGSAKIAAVGAKTAEALANYHLKADAVPSSEFSSEGLVENLRDAVRAQRVLLVRANRGRDHLRAELSKIAEVQQVSSYEQVDCLDVHDESFVSLRRGEVEFVTLGSSNSARALLKEFDETLKGRVQRGEVNLIAISGETAKAVIEMGYPIAAIAGEATDEGLIRAIRKASATSRPSTH